MRIVGFCNPDDQHHFVMRSDKVAIYALGVWVDGPAPMVVLLLGLVDILWSFAFGDIIVRRTALVQSQYQELRMAR